MTIEEIKKSLDKGDYIKIARQVGYEDLTEGRKYVARVMAKKKIKGTRGLGKAIIEAAEKLAIQNINDSKNSKGKKPE